MSFIFFMGAAIAIVIGIICYSVGLQHNERVAMVHGHNAVGVAILGFATAMCLGTLESRPTDHGKQIAQLHVTKSPNGCYVSSEVRVVLCDTDNSTGLWDFSSGQLVRITMKERDLNYAAKKFSTQVEERVFARLADGKPASEQVKPFVRPKPEPKPETEDNPNESVEQTGDGDNSE